MLPVVKWKEGQLTMSLPGQQLAEDKFGVIFSFDELDEVLKLAEELIRQYREGH